MDLRKGVVGDSWEEGIVGLGVVGLVLLVTGKKKLGLFKVTIIDPIIGSIIFTIMLFLEPIFD